jgi:hypothetical protein
MNMVPKTWRPVRGFVHSHCCEIPQGAEDTLTSLFKVPSYVGPVFHFTMLVYSSRTLPIACALGRSNLTLPQHTADFHRI